MATHNMILLTFLMVVAIIAAVAIYSNRKKTQSVRRYYQEPTLNGKNSEKDQLFFDDEENEFVDPIVDGSHYDVSKSILKDSQPKIEPVSRNNFTPQKPNRSLNMEVANEEKNEEADPAAVARAEKFFPNDLISLTLIAQLDKPFSGYELLQALLATGFRFGKMNIFHRFEQAGATGNLLFSLASAVKPGNFEMSKIGAFSSPALVLFMHVSTQQDVAATFELMLNVAQQIIEDLGGEVCDQQRQPLTEEKIALIREKITEYELSKSTSELFA